MTLRSEYKQFANDQKAHECVLFLKIRYLVCLCVVLASSITIAQTNPVPVINQPLVPEAASPGGARFVLTVNGTGFVSSSVVKWNGRRLATHFASSSRLTAIVPSAAISTSMLFFASVTSEAS